MKIVLKADKCVFDQDSSGSSNAHSNKLRHTGEGRGDYDKKQVKWTPGQKTKRGEEQTWTSNQNTVQSPGLPSF